MTLEGRRVLFISYNGMLDPLGQSQVIPYLRELSKRGVHFTLLSFERNGAFLGDGPRKCDQLRASLANYGVDWHWLRYHQKPSLPATMFDVVNGVRTARQLVRQKAVEMVHARSHIPATIALPLKKSFGVKMIFDLRGLMADEYVDADHWRKRSVAYQLTKTMERRAFASSDGIVTLTETIWPIIKDWEGLRGHDVTHAVVPCCADLELFRFSREDRECRRNELGISDRFVIVYSGSIDGWYLTKEMADFFAALRKRKDKAHLLWLTPTNHDRLRSLMKERGIDNFTILAADSRDVSSYLSACDAGLAFIKPCFSKLASSPTKYAEYLACGLPLIINAGIGDSDALIIDEKVGALVRNFNEAEYSEAAAVMEGLARESEQTRLRVREVAERLFDVRTVGAERYARLYEAVLNHT